MRLRALTTIARTAKKGEEFEIADAAGEILMRDKEAEPVKAKASPATPPATPPSGTPSGTPSAPGKGGGKKKASEPQPPATPETPGGAGDGATDTPPTA